jgi:hypothetical protein
VRVQCEIVAEHARGLLDRDLGHQRDVIEDRRDIVDQGKQAGSGHR